MGNSLPDLDRNRTANSLYSIIDTALAVSSNRRLAEPRISQFKKHYANTRRLPDLKDLLPIRKLVAFTVVVGLIFSEGGLIIHPAYSPTMSINVQNFAFNPQNTTIQAGDSVTWVNNDPVIYTLWFTNASDGSTYLLSPPINSGTTWTHAFPDPLRLNYYDFDRLYITGQLVIVPRLIGDFTPTLSTNTTVTFQATVSGGTGPYKFSWMLGDGTNSTLASPTHTYQAVGVYSVTLVITDSSTSSGFTITATHQVEVGSGGGSSTRVEL